MNIVFGADYKCTSQRTDLVAALQSFGPVTDVVSVDPNLSDYVEVAQHVAARISFSPATSVGILICGTGIGISITANKFPHVHAARCLSEQDATDARTINNANLLCLSASTPIETNLQIVKTFLQTLFPGDERRTARLHKLAAIEQSNFASPSAPTLERALSAARETKHLHIGVNILPTVPASFAKAFPNQSPSLICDPNTFAVAGKQIQSAFASAGHANPPTLILSDSHLYAEHTFVDQVQQWLSTHNTIPIAIGSGIINDLVKLAAHRLGRPYMCVATAASMDGYTAFGASITFNGVKQTFDCPAPVSVLADLEIIRRAPTQMNAAGYADLLAKITAGADWILADALGVEPVDPTAWQLVQLPLRHSLSDPAGVRSGDLEATRRLTEGLMMGGFAMQWTKSSRPASGAEHQFSHLWDMQHHTMPDGHAPSHGFKVAIGTLAVASLYEHLLTLDLSRLDIDSAVAAYPTPEQTEADITKHLGSAGELATRSRIEMKAKSITPQALRAQLTTLQSIWPTLSTKLRAHLPPIQDLHTMLQTAQAPTHPSQINIPLDRLRASYQQAYYIRRRFTVLDLVMRANLLPSSLNTLFSPTGYWHP
ncbi:MAG TPA: iron-containing alcohol dehydrogenase [Tepidisphaeraceae bacterium]|jgi:glycerol-1-phosphate dehydrogenase [NAD(P)+]|nr:iron-containing alcohol dehydrogenase [Tepidisphaeraceae bacterium]